MSNASQTGLKIKIPLRPTSKTSSNGSKPAPEPPSQSAVIDKTAAGPDRDPGPTAPAPAAHPAPVVEHNKENIEPNPSLAHKPVSFTEQDTIHFLEYLIKCKAQAGDGGNFPPKTFNGAAEELNKMRTAGGLKTGKNTGDKYTRLKGIHDIVEAIRRNSGWTWSDTDGAGITPETEAVWEAYVLKNPGANKFKNKGWPYRHLMEQLRSKAPWGTHVFLPGSTATQDSFDSIPSESAPRAPSPDWDMSQMNQDMEQAEQQSDCEEEASPAAPEPVATPAPISRKRVAAATTPPTAKRARVSAGAAAISGMTKSIDKFADGFTAAVSALGSRPRAETSPQRMTRAVQQAQALEKSWLSRDEMLDFVCFLEQNPSAATVYIALDPEDTKFRQTWIRKKLDIPAPFELD